MNTATRYANWDKPIPHLAHDYSPVRTPRNRSSNSGKLGFPVWPYLIYAQEDMMDTR
jgi:hypothetical protein